MASITKSFGRFAVVCDDPYKRGCDKQSSPNYTEGRAILRAREAGWLLGQTTSKWSCPDCLELHSDYLNRRIALGKMTKDEAETLIDPFAVALAIAMLGPYREENPNAPIAEEQPVPGGGQFGGAGASASFEEQSVTQPVEEKREEAKEEVEHVSPAESHEVAVMEPSSDSPSTSGSSDS